MRTALLFASLSIPALASAQATQPAPPAPSAQTAPAPQQPPAPAARVLSLQQAVETARTHQPQLLQARATTEAARARVDEARAPMLPQVNGSAGYQRATGNYVPRAGSLPGGVSTGTTSSSFQTYNYYNANLQANQLLWDFGQTHGRYKAAQSSASAQESSEHAVLLQTLLGVRNAYFNARAAKDLVKVARETLENQRKHLEQVQGFVEVGTQPEIALAQAKADVANARVQLINSENDYATAKAQLNRAMGVEESVDYEIADETLAPVQGEALTVDALTDEAIQTRPEIAALSLQAQAQEQTIRSIQGAYWPTLGVSTALTDSGAELNRLAWNWNAGLNLSWNIFQGGLTHAQVREARANLTNIQSQIAGQRQQVRLEVEQAWLGVRAAREALDASDEVVANARQRLLLAEGRYQTGVGSIIELSDAQVALTNAAGQRVSAEYRLASARAQLLQALGREQ